MVTGGATNGAAGCGHPALRKDGDADCRVGPVGLLAMTFVIPRTGVTWESVLFDGGLVCAGLFGRPHRAAPTGLSGETASPGKRTGTEPRPYTVGEVLWFS